MALNFWQEPLKLTQGDTLTFQRFLSDYQPPAWQLTYEIRGGSQVIEFLSTPSGNNHLIMVPAATTAGWLPGDYVMAGYAINSGTGERVQFYYNALPIYSNLAGSPGNLPTQTFAQKMLATIETVLLAKATGDLISSAVGDTRFQYLTMEELRTEHGYWKQVRANEVAKLNAKMGRPTGYKIRPRTNVTAPGPSVGMFPPFSGYYGW